MARNAIRRLRSRRGETDLRRLLIDAAVGVGLIIALAVIFALDTGSSSDRRGLSVETGEGLFGEGAGAATKPGRPLRLAVTPPEYDDMGKLLDTLGRGYRHTTVAFDDLLHADRLAEYDVVFLTCGGVPREWLADRLRASGRGSSGVFRGRPEIVEMLHESLRRFVGRGGTLYASDWQFDLVAIAFPELVDRSRMGKGTVQTVEAQVVDAGLGRRLGATIGLRFDLPSWRPAAFSGPDVTTYLRGTYKLMDGQEKSGPLLVTFPYQEGTVVFTSFHNEAQNTEMELELLRYLVFATVTAREEGRIKRTLVRGGFSPKARNLLSASRGSEPVSETYRCRQSGTLQLVLGFEDQGARLRLSVLGPDGFRAEKTGSKTFSIEVPNAAAGKWQYTITPVEIPYQNFPFTLTIAEKQKGPEAG